MLISSILLLSLLHSTAISACLSETCFDQEACILTDDMEEKCPALCYPSIKPLYNYVGTCHDKDNQLIQLQDKVHAQDREIINLQARVGSLTATKNQLTKENISCGPQSVVEEALQQVLLLKNQFSVELNKLQGTVRDTEEVMAALLQEKLGRLKVIESLEGQLAGNAKEMEELNKRIVQMEVIEMIQQVHIKALELKILYLKRNQS